MTRRFDSALPVLVLGLLLTLTACGDDTPGAGDATPLAATLHDGSIELSDTAVPAGPLSLHVDNQGTMTHEIEVFAGDSTDLPVSNSVADTSGMDLIDEVEDIAPGLSPTLDLDLDPGHYIIICNLPGHYQMGMVTELTVSG